ncbi:MAG: hypothetical protein K5856_06775 [Bacteroidaceae bacterium]|nr:hypothetical protein [Bacteroidaceae bacterium]
MQRILLNPQFESLRSYLKDISSLMLHEGKILYQKRNLIKEIITPEGLHINIKRYHKPFILNNIIYSSGLRKPKGLRAYEYPFILQKKGIDTPEPIAYIEERKWGLLEYCYFISIQAQKYSTLYDMGNATEGTYEDLAKALASFTANMHEKEVLHKDYSPGNILYKKENGMYMFTIVDINRMYFGKVDMEMGCSNFVRLWGPKRFITLIVKEYAHLRGFDPIECEGIALRKRRQFWETYQKKHKVEFKLEL